MRKGRNGISDGQPQRLRPPVSLGVGDEVSLQGVSRGGGVATARFDPAVLRGAGIDNRAWEHQQRPCASVGVESAEFCAGEGGAVFEGAFVAVAAG